MFQTSMILFQMILGVLLIIAILLQQKGVGLGSAFGGGNAILHTTRRGGDLFLFRSTIVLSLLFFGMSLAIVIIG